MLEEKNIKKKELMNMYFRKPTLKNLSQGARLEYVRRLRHMDADDVAEYFGFGGEDPHKTFRYYENNDRGPSKERLLDINYNGVNEKVIEEFVEKIIVHNDYFEWKLNFMNETIKLEIIEKSKSDCLISEYIN